MHSTDKSVNAYDEIRRAALAFLARRDHSTQELFRKLAAKHFSEENIHTVLTKLSAKGLLSDERFAEHFIHYRCEKGYGPLRIQMELRERGIAESIIHQFLKITDDKWFFYVRHAWQKRFKNRKPADLKSRLQQIRFLQYRGFTHEQINSILVNSP